MWYFLILLFLGLTLFVWSRRLLNYQKEIFRWHCEKVYPFDKKMSKKELKYVQDCIEISWWECLRPLFLFWDEMLPRLSFFCYSQRVDGDKMNKSRMAYGSLMRPGATYEFAKPVLEERKIQLPLQPGGNLAFGGLGWDIEEGHLKVYYRFHDFQKLPEVYKKLMTDGGTDTCAPQGILSWTFQGSALIETKVYRYPSSEKEAHLYSATRKDVQTDCSMDDTWQDKVNEKGQEIIALYGEKKLYLDTITVKDKDHFTLYFPQAM